MGSETYLKGIAASTGIAIGPAYCDSLPKLAIPDRKAASQDDELRRFTEAVEQAHIELQGLHDSLIRRAGEGGN